MNSSLKKRVEVAHAGGRGSRFAGARCNLFRGVPQRAALLGAVFGCGGDDPCTAIACADEVRTEIPQAMPSGSPGSPGGASLFGDDLDPAPLLEEACRQVAFGIEASPVNVHILLDRSVSMNEPVRTDAPAGPTRWDAMTSAVRSFIESPQANGAKVGLQYFGVTNGADDCSVEKYMTPAVQAGFLADVRNEMLASLDATRPGSLTPTGPALEGALAHARQSADLPENEGRATVVVLASDGLPSECFPIDSQGRSVQSYSGIIQTLERYASPPEDEMGRPLETPIRTYIVGTEELEINAESLAEAGRAQAYLVGSGASGGDIEGDFLDALLSIVLRPLTCEIGVPQEAPDTGEIIDFDRVRVSFTGASRGATREIPRATGPGGCSVGDAWYYDSPSQPTSIVFCPRTCSSLGAGDLRIELGCAQQIQ
jgi:hypothetical protein